MLHVTNTNNYHYKNKLLPKKITVLGAGVTGVTTAWYLTCAGFDVTVIDRKSPLHLKLHLLTAVKFQFVMPHRGQIQQRH